jgi:uncharacterized protein YxjI
MAYMNTRTRRRRNKYDNDYDGRPMTDEMDRGWMPSSLRRRGGFRELMDKSQLFVKQGLEVFEAMTGFETENSYTIHDHNGEALFRIGEKSGVCARQCCGNKRPFTLHIDSVREGGRFLVVKRPFRFYFHELQIYEGDGGPLLGSVVRDFSFLQRNYTIYDADRNPLLRIEGPVFSPWTFNILNNNGAQIGQIKKQWSGLMQEIFTDADNFGVQFPRNLPPTTKALLLSAVILIDFMYFEDNEPVKKKNNKRGGLRNAYDWMFT